MKAYKLFAFISANPPIKAKEYPLIKTYRVLTLEQKSDSQLKKKSAKIIGGDAGTSPKTRAKLTVLSIDF